MTTTTITTAEAAARAGVTAATIRHWCRMGAVRATKVADRWVIDLASLARRITLGRKSATNRQETAVRVVKPTDIRIDIEGGWAYLTAPYNPEANSGYRGLGGRWDSGRKAWRFEARDAGRVRELLRKYFGRDDQPVRVVDVRVVLGEVADWREQEAWFAGRRIARRPHRDSAVQLGAGVIIHQGEFEESGGSVKYPDLGNLDGIILEVRDVPADHPDLQQDGVTVLTQGEESAALDDATRAALEAERAALKARLAEINALLGG